MTTEQAIAYLKDRFHYRNLDMCIKAVAVLEKEISRLNDLVQGAIQEAPNPDDANEGGGQ